MAIMTGYDPTGRRGQGEASGLPGTLNGHAGLTGANWWGVNDGYTGGYTDWMPGYSSRISDPVQGWGAEYDSGTGLWRFRTDPNWKPGTTVGTTGTGSATEFANQNGSWADTSQQTQPTNYSGGYVQPQGTQSGYTYGDTANNMGDLNNYIGDYVFPNGIANWDWGNQMQMGLFNNAYDLLANDYTEKNNAYNQMLQELNARMNAGYSELQGYMPQVQDAYNQAQNNLGTLNPLLGNVTDAYWGMNRDMDSLRAAYQNVLNGTVPEETRRNLDEIYNNQMAQATQALNDSYDRSGTNLLDNLGARGILSGTTSQMANTGLYSNLLKEIQNAEYDYGTQKLQELIATPYKQFDAATQLYDSSGRLVDAANTALQGGLGIQNAYNSNFNNALGIANQGLGNFNALMNMSNNQAAYGQSALNNLFNQAGGLAGLASIPNNVGQNGMNAVLDMWNSLLAANTAKLTSSQASSGGGGSNDWWIGPATDIAGGIIDSIFG